MYFLPIYLSQTAHLQRQVITVEMYKGPGWLWHSRQSGRHSTPKEENEEKEVEIDRLLSLFRKCRSICLLISWPIVKVLGRVLIIDVLINYTNDVTAGYIIKEKSGSRHSSIVLSAPTILRPRVWIPSRPSLLFSICIIEILIRKGRKLNKKRPELAH